MKKSFLTLGFAALLSLVASSAFAEKTPWNEVKAPTITKVSLSAEDPKEVVVEFNMTTGDKGSDGGYVVLKGKKGKEYKVSYAKTRRDAKKISVNPENSDVFTVTAYATRKGEAKELASEPQSFAFSYPLEVPTVGLLNLGKGDMRVRFNPIHEAEKYVINYTDNGEKKSLETTAVENVIKGIKTDTVTTITVDVIRGNDKVSTNPLKKKVVDELEREWFFCEYGISTKPELNRIELLDTENLKFRLLSCTYDEKTGLIKEKGGKFTDLFDGISYYYTVLDPKTENFELTAHAYIDFINPTLDGQEGFGLMACDTLGDLKYYDLSKLMHYTNSVGCISTKYETHINGVKKSIKCGLGGRFLTNITADTIKKDAVGTEAIIEKHAFSYDNSYLVRTGDEYTITLKKDNTGYHVIYKKDLHGDDFVEEFTLYHPENLMVLDPDHIYVGFVAARGCNVTFSDIKFNVTDVKTDAPAKEEPKTLMPLLTSVECPTQFYSAKYPFIFKSNAKGNITVKTTEGKVLINNDVVQADKVYKKIIKINEAPKGRASLTDMVVEFKPLDGWEPTLPQEGILFPKKFTVAQYNTELLKYEENYKPVFYNVAVGQRTFKGNTIYVSRDGNAFGDGTEAKPVDIYTAIGYVQAGQTIVLKKGTYYLEQPIWIQKYIDGTAKKRIVMKGEDPKEHTVLDFSRSASAPASFNLKGNYWTLENIDITNTPENSKGMQIWGNYNIVKNCDAYLNGDTGIQIAGQSMDKIDEWPSYNTIINCESFGNCDPAQNNADGFAAKLTVGYGNKFINCVSHHNVDDGWDLYAKIETGPIGAVLLENCVCYKNGTKLDGTGKGDGNGFKLGGDGIAVPHLLKNSLSFKNGVNGVTSNSNPALKLENVTSVQNGNLNFSLYGKGTLQAVPRTFTAKNILSIGGGVADDLKEKPELRTADNYWFNGSKGINSDGVKYEESVFQNIDTSKFDNGYLEDGKTMNRIPRNEDGSFDFGTLYQVKPETNLNAGWGAK